MALAEKIRILLVKRGNISEAELARRLGISPQNLHNKMKRDNFTESDLEQIAATLVEQLLKRLNDDENAPAIHITLDPFIIERKSVLSR